MTRLRRLPHAVMARLTHPIVQVLAAVGGVLGGAALIGQVALGIAIIVVSLVLLADGLFRDDAKRQDGRRRLRSVRETHDDVIQNYRRAP